MITVTGANGLAGSYIVKELVAHGEKVRALVRPTSSLTELEEVKDKIEIIYADVTNYTSLEDAFTGSDVVIHTAALVSYHPADKEQMRKINVNGTRHVVNACLQTQVPVLLHVSSVAALGKNATTKEIDENTKWIDDATVSDYAQSKHEAELEVWRGSEEGLQVIVVNPSVILAPTDFNKSSAQLFGYVWKEKKFFTEGTINTIDVRDVAKTIRLLIDKKIYGHRFILSNEAISYQQFFTKVAGKFNKNAPSVKVSKPWLQLVANLEALRSFLTGSKPLITKHTANLAGKNYLYQNKKIKEAIQIEFQPIDATIAWCCAEYMKKIENKK
ncbi:MAG: NAD-dependent epimerase/dehydratase family protein [Cyclobacteriaceae bacterium]|jgi:nucleoside-diphosphate-sugar epimerase|nr:NAD-dependent epimerase/dehydratase family protein [Cyclobacteriaceae bacterium]